MALHCLSEGARITKLQSGCRGCPSSRLLSRKTGSYPKRQAPIPLQAMSGFISLTGYPDRPGVVSSVNVSDLSAGMYGATGVLGALWGASCGFNNF